MTTTFQPDHHPDVLVVRLDGSEDGRDIVRAVEARPASTASVIVDVSALVLSDVPRLRALAAALVGAEVHAGIVCSRLSGRRLLSKLVAPTLPVFPTPEEAVAALAGAIAPPTADPWNSDRPR